MLLPTALISGLLLAAQAFPAAAHGFAKRSLDIAHGFRVRSDGIEDRLRRHALEMLEGLEKRQDTTSTSTTVRSSDASNLNLNTWDVVTAQACGNALAALNGQASNPSGVAVCYNLPFLDNSTGVFQAELRMYNISAPIDPWVGVTSADISMTLSYLGATVQTTNGTFIKRDSTLSWPPIRARGDGELVERQDSSSLATMTPMKVLDYVGQINSNLMGTAMTQAQLQPLLIPTVVLSAINPTTKKAINTTISSTEASFVSGVFAKQATTTTSGAASSASALVATSTPFVVPGTKLAFFPTGLVVTCAWAGGFMLAVGLGTVGRIQFRDQYRRRIKREVADGIRTI